MGRLENYITDRMLSIIEKELDNLSKDILRKLMKVLEGVSAFYNGQKALLVKQLSFIDKKKADMIKKTDVLNKKVASFMDTSVLDKLLVSDVFGNANEIKKLLSGLVEDLIDKDVSKVYDAKDSIMKSVEEMRKMELTKLETVLNFLDEFIIIIKEKLER